MARVAGFSIDVPTDPALYEVARVGESLVHDGRGDIVDHAALREAFDRFEPDIVFHLAAQSLVREGYRTPVETMAANVMGTVNLLDAIRLRGKPCAAVIVTSDKCYENIGQVWGYRENDRLGGSDPYSASKGMAEIATASYRRSYFPADRIGEHGIRIASARAGNVLGGGDWARDRIAVDLAKGFAAGEPVSLRNPHALRPWQHVLEPLSGYLLLAARLSGDDAERYCDAWNFGPSPTQAASVGTLARVFASAWGEGATVIEAPDPHAPKEAAVLKMTIDKAVAELAWTPCWHFPQTIERTVDWYRRFLTLGEDARALCEEDLDAYEQAGD